MTWWLRMESSMHRLGKIELFGPNWDQLNYSESYQAWKDRGGFIVLKLFVGGFAPANSTVNIIKELSRPLNIFSVRAWFR